MITKEDILESITGALLSDKPTHSINIPIGWIFQAMQQYAEEYHRAELLKLNKSDVSNRGGSIPYESLSDSFKEIINSIEDNLNK